MYTRCPKNVTNLSCYNFDVHEPILAIFGRKVIEKVSSQKMLSSFSFPSHLTMCLCSTGGTGNKLLQGHRSGERKLGVLHCSSLTVERRMHQCTV